jgi:hypothetical protein
MFNTKLFNSVVFNHISTTSTIVVQDDITYNGYSLQNENITISKTDFYNWNSVSSDTYNNPLTDLWWELNYFFRSKTVVLEWYLKASSWEELNNRIDDFKKILWQNNKILDIKVNGTIRRAKASCINIDSLFWTREHYHISIIPFIIQFRVISDFFQELTRQNQSFTWLTSGFIEELTNRWSVRTNPVVNILLNSVSWTNQIYFEIWDRRIIISDTFSNSDSIIIDCQSKKVKINNVDVDYSWVFPILETWVNSYEFWINWTVNYDITVSYFNNFL